MSRTDGCGQEGLIHWVGDHNNTLHGNGYGSRDMEHGSGDEDEVTCRLCHSLLAARARELAEHPATPTEETAEVSTRTCSNGERSSSGEQTAEVTDEDREALRLTESERESLMCDCTDYDHPFKPGHDNQCATRLSGQWLELSAAQMEERVLPVIADRLKSVQVEVDDLRARLAKVEALADRADRRRDVDQRLVTTLALRAALANPDAEDEGR